MKPLLGKTILVVDDEVDLCELTAEEIAFAGAKVLQASSGNEALKVLEKNHVDLILSDIKMPNGTGMDLLHSVKSGDRNVTMILLMTGCSEFQIQDVLHAGAEGVFSKPCNFERLIETIARLLHPLEKRLRAERVPLPQDFVLSLEIEGLEDGKKLGILNMSRGGMFVAHEGASPEVGQVISFRIRFATQISGTDCFSGFGICRWLRREQSIHGKPGFGVEYMGLEEKSLKFLLKLIEALKLQTYIPKG